MKVYKMMKLVDMVNMELLFKKPDITETCRHSLKLMRDHVRTPTGKYFKQMVENYWILLPQKVVEANSACRLKKRTRQVHGHQVHPDINGIRLGVCFQHPYFSDSK